MELTLYKQHLTHYMKESIDIKAKLRYPLRLLLMKYGQFIRWVLRPGLAPLIADLNARAKGAHTRIDNDCVKWRELEVTKAGTVRKRK